MADGWIEWKGGADSEDESQIWSATSVRLRDGRELGCVGLAPCLRWRHIGDSTDIVAYLVDEA